MIARTNFNIPERLFLGKLLSNFSAPIRMSTKEWAETYRYLSPDVSSRPGKMDCSLTPWMLFLLKCLDDPKIKIIIGRKPAQIAWTEIINCYLGKIIHIDPRNIMIAFPRQKSTQKFYKEKLKPYIESTPPLREKIPNLAKLSYSHIPFENGFLILANIGSAEDGKSSMISVMILEEPDGVKHDVNNQGNGLDILIQRLKSVPDSKLIYGGTPTALASSQVQIAFKRSNQMFFQVPCHKCGDFHTLNFDNLKYDTFSDRRIDELYGKFNPETAYYQCPLCNEIWSFEQKNKNVFAATDFFNLGWEITKPQVKDVYGFSFNELLSNFEKSSFVNLAKQYLRARQDYKKGSDGALKAFTNNSMGLPYERLNIGLELKQLKKNRLNYSEQIIPYAGLILTAGIDVQHNRFAIIVRAWGRQGQSWLVHWTEIFGDVLDWDDSVWNNLTTYIQQKFQHESGDGRFLKIIAASIDSSDGSTTELVYRWVLEMNKTNSHIYAIKGIGIGLNTSHEIFKEPAIIEVQQNTQTRKTLAETMGVNVFLLGAHRAHSEILRRFALKGTTDRYYHCETAYGSYEEGILSCVADLKGGYVQKGGVAKEVIDCEKMALHANHAIQVRNYTPTHWEQIENHIHSSNLPKRKL